jgi:hypothetical protein
MYNDVYNTTGFEWDEHNIDKNWYRHQVTDRECEEIFFNAPLVLTPDVQHSQQEQRYYALGRTDADHWLFVAFTIRNTLIRVISALEMTPKESQKYAKHVQRYAKFQK